MKTVREVNRQGQGAIIFNVSSSGGYEAEPGLAFYASSKFGKSPNADHYNSSHSYSYAALEGFTEAFRKELRPEWKIRVCILEPGVFDTERERTFIEFGQHPAYAVEGPTSTSDFRHRRSFTRPRILGDPVRGAQAIVRLSREPRLPMRMPLGSDSLAVLKTKAGLVIKDAERFAQFSRMSDKEDIDGVAYGDMIGISLEKRWE